MLYIAVHNAFFSFTHTLSFPIKASRHHSMDSEDSLDNVFCAEAGALDAENTNSAYSNAFFYTEVKKRSNQLDCNGNDRSNHNLQNRVLGYLRVK